MKQTNTKSMNENRVESKCNKHELVPFAKMEDGSTKFICKWCGVFIQ
jgi:hypothetical protein